MLTRAFIGRADRWCATSAGALQDWRQGLSCPLLSLYLGDCKRKAKTAMVTNCPLSAATERAPSVSSASKWPLGAAVGKLNVVLRNHALSWTAQCAKSTRGQPVHCAQDVTPILSTSKPMWVRISDRSDHPSSACPSNPVQTPSHSSCRRVCGRHSRRWRRDLHSGGLQKHGT